MTYRVVKIEPCEWRAQTTTVCGERHPILRCDGCQGDGTRTVEVPFPESGRLLVSEDQAVEVEHAVAGFDVPVWLYPHADGGYGVVHSETPVDKPAGARPLWVEVEP